MTDHTASDVKTRLETSINKLKAEDMIANMDNINRLAIALTMIDDRKATRSQTYREAVNITYEVLGD